MEQKPVVPKQAGLPHLFDEVKATTKPLSFDETVLMPLEMLYERADQGMLHILKEDRRVERKPASMARSSELADYFSMWANTAPEGGLFAVGISDDGKALGCLKTEIQHLNKLEHEVGHQCPDAVFSCRRVEILRDSDGQPDYILLFWVKYNPSRVVFTVRSEAFNRRGESKHKLAFHEILDLKNDKGEVRVEEELYPEYEFPGDFDKPLIERFAKAVNDNLSVPLRTDELFVQRHLGAIKGGRFVPNGACVLAFANDPRIKFAGAKAFLIRYQGDHEGVGSELNTVKHQFVEGNVPAILESVRNFLTVQLREFSQLGPDGRFYPSPEYPQPVWIEAVLNACIHRSYGTFKSMAIYVKLFDSRLVIESPGGFPPGITGQNIYSVVSHPRNPFLMEALWFLGYTRNMGEGARRMLKLMTDNSLPPPEFEQKEVGHSMVRVTLRNNVQQRKVLIDSAIATTVISPDLYKTLTDEQRSIVNHMAEHGTINISQAARIIGRSWKASSHSLAKLAARGVLKHVHRSDLLRDPDAHYVLAPAKDGESA